MKINRRAPFFVAVSITIIALNTNEANAVVSITPQFSVVDMGGGGGSRVEIDWKVPCWYAGSSCALP